MSSHPATRTGLANNLRAFVRMYEPHEAREDTVIFPAFRQVTRDRTFAQLGERFAELQDQKFGPHGFTDIVSQVAGIEHRFGLEDLTQYMPRSQ
jgi:hemerythrin superfamily protein